MSINSVVISGNLTRDPELKQTGSNLSVLRIGMAVNDFKKEGDGYNTYANFVDVVVFGKRAEVLNKLLKKGAKVCVFGKLHYSSWEDNDQRKSKIEIIANEVELMSPKTDEKKQGDNPTYDNIPF